MSSQGVLEQLQNGLRGKARTNSSWDQLGRLRAALPLSDYRRLGRWLGRNRGVWERSIPTTFPSDIPALWTLRPWEPMALHLEMEWAAAYLASVRGELREYVAWRAEYFERYCDGDVVAAIQLCVDAEKEFGPSYTLIKKRFAAFDLVGDRLASSEYYDIIRRSTKREDATPWVARHLAARSDKHLRYQQYADNLDRSLRRMREPMMASFLRRHLLPERLGIDELSAVLAYESKRSFVDYYESWVLALGIVTFQHDPRRGVVPAESLALRSSLAAAAQTGDPRVKYLRADGTGMLATEVKSRLARALLSGSNAEVVEMVGRMSSGQVDIWSLVALAYAGSESNGIALANQLGRVAKLMVPVLGRYAEADDAQDALRRIASENDDLLLSWGILSFLARQSHDATGAHSADADIARSRMCSLVRELDRSIGPRDSALSFAEELLQLAQMSVRPVRAELSEPLGSSLEVEALLVDGDFGRACERLKVLLTHSPTPRLRVLEVVALLRAKRLRECLVGMVALLAESPFLQEWLPIQDLYDAMPLEFREANSGMIELPVFLQMVGRYRAERVGSEVQIWQERFQERAACERPSDLPTASFSRDVLVYYWAEVCVESVLELSVSYESPAEVLEERIRLCGKLASLDAANRDAYAAEVNRLVRRKTLGASRKVVDTSRVYVDTPGLRAFLVAELESNYARFLLLADRGGLEGLGARAPSNGRMVGKEAVARPPFSGSEVSELFSQMIERILQEFLFNPRHGLDGYLSVRIRHGTLANHLRGPVEKARLYSRTEGVPGRRERNDYWLGKATGSTTELKRLSVRLQQFSEAVDAIIRDVVEWVHVRSASQPRGLISLCWTAEAAGTLAPEAFQVRDVGAFVDYALTLLTAGLFEVVTQIQHRMRTEVKQRTNQLTNSLQSDLRRMTPVPGLVDAVGHLRIELVSAIDAVAGWFQPGRAEHGTMRGIRDAIDVAQESASWRFPSLQVSIDFAEDDGREFEHDLAVLVDIFLILLENASRHSGLSASKALVRVRLASSELVIDVESACAPGVNTVAVQNRLEDIRTRIANGGYLATARSEGGSGLCKIAKILRYPSDGARLSFEFASADQFRVSVHIPTRDILHALDNTTR